MSSSYVQVKDATAKIKELADVRTQSMDSVDMILRIYHNAVQSGDLKVGQSAKLDALLEKVSTQTANTHLYLYSMLFECSVASF